MDLSPLEASREKEEEADRCIAGHDLDGALQCLTKAVFLDPKRWQLYAKRAQVYWDLCDVKSAISNYRQLFVTEPNPPQRIKDQLAALLDLHGYSMLTLGEAPSIALGYFNESIQLNALDEVCWLHRAVANIKTGHLDKAVQDVDHCICINSRDVEYFVLRAKLHWRLHLQEKATADINRAAQLQPDHPEVLAHEQRLLRESKTIYERARKQLMAHQFEEAIQNLSRATEITPEETELYILRASAYRELGEYHTALRDTEKALTCRRHKLDSLRSEKLEQQHETPTKQSPGTNGHSNRDTSAQFREIVQQRSLILHDIGIKFLQQKSYQLAINAMNQAIRGQMELTDIFREQFSNPQCFINRGDAYRGLDNFQAALADYHHALELLPGDNSIQSRIALVHYQFGIDLFNRALFDKAELEFGNAITHDHNVPSYYVRRGDAARYLEKHQAACADYQQAILLNPNDTETRTKLQQYNVSPLPIDSNQRLIAPSKTAVPSRALSPQQRRSQELQANVDGARISFKKTHQRVQDLFRNRPVVPPPSMHALK